MGTILSWATISFFGGVSTRRSLGVGQHVGGDGAGGNVQETQAAVNATSVTACGEECAMRILVAEKRAMPANVVTQVHQKAK